jgi:hypothetical protein
MSTRRLTPGTVAWLCALVGLLTFSCVSAQAATTHEFLSQITEVPANSGAPLTGPLSGVNGMTVDSGDLYLTEHIEGTGTYRTDVFDAASGAFVSQFAQPSSLEVRGYAGIAVGHSTGEAQVYVAADEAVAVFDAAGSPLADWDGTDTPSGGFGQSEGVPDVAVDNSSSLGDWAAGNVYVADRSEAAIDVFKPEAGGREKYVTQLTGTSSSEHFVSPEGVAVDESNGDVLVVDGRNVVDVFEPTVLDEYMFVRQLTGTPAGAFAQGMVTGVTVDGSNGEIYVAEGQLGVIDQFSSAGVYLGRLTGTPTGLFGTLISLAVDPATHHVFVGELNKGVDVFGSSVTIPDVTVTEPVSGVTPTGVTMHGTVNPDEAGEAMCEFEFGTSTSYGQRAVCTEHIGEGGAPVAVESVAVTGLQPDTTYHYRLDATNAADKDTNTGECPEDCGEFTTTGPGIQSESVSNVASTSATLTATIDPNEAPTTYYFQYGTENTEACSGNPSLCTEVPSAPGVAIGSGTNDVNVTPQHLQGLEPDTTYHYRVVAVSGLAGGVQVFDGPDRSFSTQRTGESLLLPDGRDWELVSPPDKHGALIEQIAEAGLVQASVNGDAIAYLTSAPTEAEPPGYSNEVQVLSTRGPGGWESRDIAPPNIAATGLSVGYGQEYRFFSEDLSSGIVQPFGRFNPSLSGEASEQTAYLRTSFSSGDVGDPCSSSCYRPLVTGAAGYANVPPGTVFGSGECSGFVCGPEFVGASPDLSHVVLTSNVALTSMPGDTGGLYEWAGGKLALVSVLPDGKPAGEAVGPVLGYGESNSFGTANAISDDGSRVVWSEAGGEKKVYVRDMVTGVTTPFEVPQVDGTVIGTSKDGSYVYFVTGTSLYVSHDAATTLIAVLSAHDEADWGAHKGGEVLSHMTSRVSPNGRWLAFMSQESLTGYDTHDAISGEPDEEVYLYDASTNHLTCASCDPTGARPVGVEYGKELRRVGGFGVWQETTWFASNIPGWTAYASNKALYQSRYLSNSGRLFFNSNDALVPQDVNGTEDVYEYEPPGVGDCTSSSATFSKRSDGCVGLISSGNAAEESAFLDASETGGDVFFMTVAKLLPQDFDTSFDVYDAHECSAQAPCMPVPAAVPPPCSTGDACKPSPSPQPAIFGSPSSSTFSGMGNVNQTAPGPVVRSRSLTRSQKLANALKACRKDPKRKRLACRRKARTTYGPQGKTKAKAKNSSDIGKGLSVRSGR